AMGFLPGESLSRQQIRANFYKCGDETAEPHYISWSPIDLPAPDFHAPQFFGLLEME
ncbi:MAG: carbohydrate-binding family 9-like protein, partial [Proteiniphilum sp.]